VKKLFFLSFTLLFISCHPKKEILPIQFFKEIVYVTIDTNEVTVIGNYYLRNRTDTSKIVKLFYPFPIDSAHPYPYYIEVAGMPFTKEQQGVSFKIKIKPLETRQVIIEYKQKIFTNSAKYILTSAREWKEPIEDASFVVDIPKGFEPKISYDPDSVVTKGNRTLYYINRKNLFPGRDLDVVWKSSLE